MIVVANRIPVAAGHEADFEERMRTRMGLIDETPGFVRNLVLRPTDVAHSKADSYVVMTFWQDMESFEAWTRSDSFRQAHSRRPPAEMFRGPNTLEIHEVLQDTGDLVAPGRTDAGAGES